MQKYTLLALVCLPALCFSQKKPESQKWYFENDFTTFTKQTYYCGGKDTLQAHLQSIEIFEDDRFVIAVVVYNPDNSKSREMTITKKDIDYADYDVWGRRRELILTNGCSFQFYVNGKTPTRVAVFFVTMFL